MGLFEVRNTQKTVSKPTCICIKHTHRHGLPLINTHSHKHTSLSLSLVSLLLAEKVGGLGRQLQRHWPRQRRDTPTTNRRGSRPRPGDQGTEGADYNRPYCYWHHPHPAWLSQTPPPGAALRISQSTFGDGDIAILSSATQRLLASLPCLFPCFSRVRCSFPLGACLWALGSEGRSVC